MLAVYSDGQNQLAPAGYSYDGAGDVSYDGSNQYVYDAEGRICAVYKIPYLGIGGWIVYVYDAAGNRVAKGQLTNPNPSFPCDITNASNGYVPETGYVVGPSGEQLTEVAWANNGWNQWNHTNVYAGGKQIATYDPVGLHLYIDDPLGTRRVQVAGSGASPGTIEATYQSLPFGDGLTPTFAPGYNGGPFGLGPTENHFTGKERDTESGNDFFFARYYGSAVGRFVSPDSGVDQDEGNPQSWNLYSYVQNNPLSRVDEDGHSVNVCDNTGQCNVVSNDEYTAAQQGDNGGMYVPTLDSVGMSGNGAGQFYSVPIFGDSGIVGSATYVSDGPTDYYANWAGLNTFIPAANVVNAIGGLELSIMFPVEAALASCSTGGSKGGCAANLALAALPAAGELRAGGKLLKAAEELTATEYISKYLKGGINRVFPGQFNGATIKEIQEAAAAGNRDARTALKLLTDGRFKK